jgi:hypothetical protein
MRAELNSSDSNENTSIIGLFRMKELRWPLITSLVIQISQQLCGVNAVCDFHIFIFEKIHLIIDNVYTKDIFLLIEYFRQLRLTTRYDSICYFINWIGECYNYNSLCTINRQVR